MITSRELLEKVKETLNPEEIVDLLGLSSEDVVAAFEDEIIERFDEIVAALEIHSCEDDPYEGGIKGYDYYV